MTKLTRFFPLLALPAVAITVAAAPWRTPGTEVELDEAEAFIEFNHTDGDFGIQFFWDGDPWDRMTVTNTAGGIVMKVKAAKNLQRQGLAEGFFESAEPTIAQLPMDEFLERFPEGCYEFEGETLDGDPLVGEAEFTHTLPAPPANLFPGDGDMIDSTQPLVASFDAVTTDFQGNALEPEYYEVIIETEGEIDRDIKIILEGDLANPSFTVPPEFLQPGGEYKLEVICAEESGNKIISETVWDTL